MKRALVDLSSEQVEQLLLLYCALAETNCSTKKGQALHQKTAGDLLKLCADLGLPAHDASELHVVLEYNRRNHWLSLTAPARRIVAASSAALQ